MKKNVPFVVVNMLRYTAIFDTQQHFKSTGWNKVFLFFFHFFSCKKLYILSDYRERNPTNFIVTNIYLVLFLELCINFWRMIKWGRMNEQTQFKGFITAKILNYVCINIRIMIKFYNHQLVLLSIPHCNYKSSHYTVSTATLHTAVAHQCTGKGNYGVVSSTF